METKVQKNLVIKSGKLPNERREFLKKAGGLAVMSLFGVSFFTSCAEEDDTIPNNTPPSNDDNDNSNPTGINISGNTITIDLEIVTQLRSAGGWILILDARTLVVNDGGIKALTSVCTHSGCDRNWQFSNSRLTCTCHNSVFTTSGEVVNGPANRPLDTFTVNRDGDIVVITK